MDIISERKGNPSYGDAEKPLCDFEKLCSAMATFDEQAAADWYKSDYLESLFAGSASDTLRSLKNGLIVIFGYMRAAVLRKNKSPAAFNLEYKYMTLVETCLDERGVFKLFLRAFKDFSLKQKEINAKSDRFDKLKICTDYIVTNLNTALNLTDIALFCGYNPSYLSRKFKSIYGISISHFISCERLKTAASILKYSDRSIAEISSYLKFSSQSHFQQAFKKYFDMTPLQYRKLYGDKDLNNN